MVRTLAAIKLVAFRKLRYIRGTLPASAAARRNRPRSKKYTPSEEIAE
ncbi:MAG: hypothetical protein OJF60_001531 [Burkholderiaceae bacterium]|nr:MAG: hypothetical protein OJF60_001531 [Burkholderiaceae bacterium]